MPLSKQEREQFLAEPHIAALSVAAPAFRTSMEHLVGFVPQLTAAAHELALRLPTGRAR